MAAFRVAAIGDVGPGTGKVVEAGGKTLALFNANGTFYAIDNVCTHMGCALGEGTLEGTVVTCPCHGSNFDPGGRCTSGPSPRAMDTLDTEVREGKVLVTFRRFRQATPDKEPI